MKKITILRWSAGPVTFALGAALLAVLSGCGAPGGEAEPRAEGEGEKVGSASAAVAWLGDAYWGQWGNNGPDFPLGSASDRTCFLTGVHGQLLGTTTSVASGTPAAARVFVDYSTNQWFLQTHQGVGDGVNARAACVPYTGNRAFFFSGSGYMYDNGSPDGVRSVVTIPQSSPNRQCFLTGVSAWNGFNEQWAPGAAYLWAPGSTDVNPNAWLFVTDVQYAINPYGYGLTPGGSAEAVCVDVGSVQGWVGPLSQNSVWWFSNEANLACGLTTIAGQLSSDPLGGNDGVGLSYGNGSSWWGVNATSGKTVAATCFL
jgi:hypothetical protein